MTGSEDHTTCDSSPGAGDGSCDAGTRFPSPRSGAMITPFMDEPSLSIAVMPFRDLTPEASGGHFALGFVEDVIANLTRFRSLRVVASESTFGLARGDRAAEDVAGEWDLQYVLTGSLRRHGATLRIAAQLTRAEDRTTVWAERFDAPIEDVFAIQDEIAATVAGKLAVRVDDAELDRVRRTSFQDLDAYDCWLRGMDCLRRGTLEGDEEARTFFEQALRIDPGYARAYAGLSLSHFNEWTCQTWHLFDESGENAFQYAAKAAELDDADAMVRAVLARVCRFRRRHSEADRHAARALELNPNDAHVLIQVAIAELFDGQAERAIELARRAVRFNPLHPPWYLGIIGWSLFMSGQPGDALPYLQAAGESIVDFAAYRAACAVLLGEPERARHEYAVFVREHREKIAFGREPEPGEALRWAVQVEPFRRLADSERMPAILAKAGIDEVDVERALATRADRMVQPAGIERPPGNAFRREGRIWSLDYEGLGAKLVELKGFHDIARLLREPHTPVHCLELSGGAPPSHSRQEVLDSRARREYRERIEDLREQMDRAESDNDPARLEAIRAELERVTDELARAVGFGGHPGAMADPAARARSATTWRIRSAIKKIRAALPRLGLHLENSIRTGTFCEYAPEAEAHWDL